MEVDDPVAEAKRDGKATPILLVVVMNSFGLIMKPDL
jgi:hypothetical protein